MAQDLSNWLYKHQTEIRRRWWAAAQELGLAPETFSEHADGGGRDAVLSRLLAAVSVDEPFGRSAAETLAKELTHSDLLTLLRALRQALFALVVQHKGPQGAEFWPLVDQRVGRVDVAIAGVFDAEREHWQTLYNLTRELSASIDLGYVLQNAITCILDALDAERGAVLLLDPQTNLLTPRATQDWGDTSPKLADLPPDWQRGHGAPHILSGSQAEESALETFLRDEDEMLIAAPLIANGRLHGILAVATVDTNGFAPRQLDLIDAVVSNLVSSLGGSEVIQTLNDQSRELGSMLRQQQEESSKREAILASIADGVVFNDRRGKIVFVNRAAELILAVRAEDLQEHTLKDMFDLFTAGARDEMLEAMGSVLADPQVEVSPEAVQTVLEIDKFIINAHFSPVITEQDEFLGIVTILRDITKEVEADQAKSEFVSTVSHELRTPMTAIKGFTDLLHSGVVGEVNKEQKRFLGIVRSNTDRLTALINDLLDISRVETGRVRFESEPIQLDDVVKSVIDALAPNAESKEHTLSLRVEAGLPEIMGDPDRLNQVFTNLVGNAIDYTPHGGEVSVDIYSVKGAVRADVKDSGIGIQSEDLSRIFERFYRADHPVVQESRGTGLGLPIVKMFVEMHGGRVWAQSETGKGSSFTVLLPLTTAQPWEGLKPLPPTTAVKTESRHVLVADDDPDIAELIRFHLDKAGFNVSMVGHGVEVLEIARRHCPDLIILDILLPDMDGRAVLETLKSAPATADIPVVMLTVVADDGTAFDLGAVGYLSKPVNVEDLQAAVRVALARRGRILVVEDDWDTIEMMRLALRRVGYNVDVAADGYEALSLARRWLPQAIVLDLRLPGMDGYEALTHLKRNLDTQNIPIVVISAHVEDLKKETKRLKAMGVEILMPKPFTANQLVAAIDQVVNVTLRARKEKVESSDERLV